MRFLCISDLHGHADALRAVLRAAEARGYARLLVAGDLCFPGPDPLGTWKLLMAAGATCVQGIGDRALATLDVAKLQARNDHERERLRRLCEARTELGELIVARLAKLPTSVRIPLPSGDELLVVHGSPADPTEGMDETMSDAELLALIRDDPADVVVCGSTHVPFDRWVQGVRVVNVGSVGEAPGGRHAHATFIEASAEGITVEQIVVPRDAVAA
ncbi:MAG TPA: metallophosphoesterase family protein [Polyangiaceae bacterium]|nr:metallophosphoesterase family protein [Polyangiaceae bacterium]